MSTRQDIIADEECIRELLLYEKEYAAIRAFEKMRDYFVTNDYLEGYHHCEIIEYIYLTKHYQEETLCRIALENHVGERTLYRYRKKYIICFQFHYKEELNNEQGGKNSFFP